MKREESESNLTLARNSNPKYEHLGYDQTDNPSFGRISDGNYRAKKHDADAQYNGISDMAYDNM